MKLALFTIGLVLVMLGWSPWAEACGEDAVYPETKEITAMGIK